MPQVKNYTPGLIWCVIVKMQMHQKHCTKHLRLCVEVYIKHKWISNLDLDIILKIPHYVYVNILKYKRLLAANMLSNGYSKSVFTYQFLPVLTCLDLQMCVWLTSLSGLLQLFYAIAVELGWSRKQKIHNIAKVWFRQVISLYY